MRDVSVLIINFNERDVLTECLRSLRTTIVRTQIIVVDNGSTDGSVEAVRKDFPEAELLVNRQNERFARPNNDAFAKAEGRYIFLLNNDTEVKPQALEILVEYLDRHQDVAMAGPQLLNPDGT
ncbi:MAG TPA: glycosyltransferase, partial [Bacteroidota bacterium]